MTAYYNEIEPAAAHVLECLIKDGVIAHGVVDTRSITEVEPGDVSGFAQAHFFAGGGLWSVAARLAGWPDDRPMWTGSCPCQPFSVAGKGAGTDDPRHLWPHFFRLIRSCRPPVVMGEQVAGKAGYGWLDGVSSDLEGEGYASRAVDIPACAVDAPHIRQRLYWVAHADRQSIRRRVPTEAAGAPQAYGESTGQQRFRADVSAGGSDMADANGGDAIAEGLQRSGLDGLQPEDRCDRRHSGDEQRATPDLVDAIGKRRERRQQPEYVELQGASQPLRSVGPPGASGSFWRDAEWAIGADGKTRRVKPGIRLLVDGLPGRVGLLRIGGNAIVAPLAAEVIKALMDTEQ